MNQQQRKNQKFNSSSKKTPRQVKRGKFTPEVSIPAALITANEGIVTIRRTEEISGELIKNPYVKKLDKIYHGMSPFTLEIYSNIFPKITQRLLSKKKLRLRGYFNLAHEPMTRNPFTGDILDPVKKKKVLKERGVIDEEGYLLNLEGKRMNVKDCWIKVDVSDIDFIKSEFHALEQSGMIEHSAKSMKRTGMVMDDIMKWIVIAAFAAIVVIVIVLSGAI